MLSDYASNAKVKAIQAKAVASAFAHEFVDQVTPATIAIIKEDPDGYAGLFFSIIDYLCETLKLIEQLETELDKVRE